jgi:hypothetical protein
MTPLLTNEERRQNAANLRMEIIDSQSTREALEATVNNNDGVFQNFCDHNCPIKYNGCRNYCPIFTLRQQLGGTT